VKRRTGPSVSLFRGANAAFSTRRGDSPLYRETYRRVRAMILDGTLRAGDRLPSSRAMAEDLRVSRNTIEAAFGQLRSEGYVERRVGAGTFVSADAQAAPSGSARRAINGASRPTARTLVRLREKGERALSRRGQTSSAPPPDIDADADASFGVCRPGLDLFPVDTWNRLVARRARRSMRDLLDEQPPDGLPPLRAAIASYLRLARGVRCTPEQVIVMTSTQQAINLVARLLIDAGDQVWLEEPCYNGARHVFAAAGARIVPVPVDEGGLNVDLGATRAPRARLAYVTPSHQFPLGVTMTLKRRLALIQWANLSNAWILEDDYDSDLHYDGRPLAALQGIDDSDRVLYAGTFNKIMFPSLRLAYLVVPSDLVELTVAARRWMDGHTTALTQAVMADFMHDGHFGTHVRAMRQAYRDRRDALEQAVEKYARRHIRLGPRDGGMHAVGWLPRRTTARVISTRRRGVLCCATPRSGTRAELCERAAECDRARRSRVESGVGHRGVPDGASMTRRRREYRAVNGIPGQPVACFAVLDRGRRFCAPRRGDRGGL
jgi:GntR family transcriptional regulator / MocR family aminotransferase